MEPTRKLYYEQVDLHETEATVRSVEGDLVITDRTVLFPEGGGQVGDRGWIGTVGDIEAGAVVDTRKRGGRLVIQQDLPMIHVETEVVHQQRGDDDQRPFQHGGDVFRLGVAIGVVGIGRQGGQPDGQQRGDGRGDVHHAFQRVGEQRDAAGQPPGECL